jgi:NAD(P)-dependent dehydrogenase (short-subunit alcohol dehydrogenase family)
MNVHDIAKLADDEFGGDRSEAIASLARIKSQDAFVNMNEYVTAKLVVAWWAAALSRRLPAGMTVNAVSPGSAPGSNFGRDAPFGMKIMIGFMKTIGPLLGMAGGLEVAARRYVDAAELGDDDTGHFYATAHPKKLVGPMGIQTLPETLDDHASQEAALEAMVKLTGTGLPNRAQATSARAS